MGINDTGQLRKSTIRKDGDGNIIIGCEVPYVEKMKICEGVTGSGEIIYGYHFKKAGNDYIVDRSYMEHKVVSFSYKLRQ